MAQFPILRLTRAGQDLVGMSQGGGKLIFVRVELGDGQLGEGESVEMLHALKRRVMQLPLQGYLNEGNGKARLRFVVDNSALTVGFFNREIGIVAKMEDGDEQLYAYTNAGNYADYIPSKDTPIDSEIIDLHIVIGNASHVVLETQNGAYATKIDLEEHRTAAELDHPEKSVKRKHLADNVYTLPKPEAANNARFLRNDGTWQQVTADNIGACNKADVAGIYRKIGDQIVDRNTDWNTLTEPMTYIVSGASIDDMHHAPSEYNFGVLDVLRTSRDPEKRTIQIYYPHFSQQTLEKGGMWIRFSNSASWTQWRHIPTKAENDDRYVKKSGDEITGTLFAPKIQTDNGFEVLGDAGLFFKKHGGGWYMSDDDWMRVIGGKGIHTSGEIACDKGFIGNLQGTSNNSKTLEDKSLQWIINQINAAKTGIVAGNLAQNGWVKFANGLIVQWGEVRNTEYNNFPIAYTKFAHVFVVAGVSGMSPTGYSTSYGATLAGDPTLTRFFPVIGDTERESPLPDKTGVGRWMSIGV